MPDRTFEQWFNATKQHKPHILLIGRTVTEVQMYELLSHVWNTVRMMEKYQYRNRFSVFLGEVLKQAYDISTMEG